MSAVPAEIAGIGSTAMKLRVSPGFDPLKAQIGPDEYFLLSRIDGSQTLREVILSTGLPVDRAVTIVTRLRTIGAVLLPGETAAPQAAPARPTPAPQSAPARPTPAPQSPPARPTPAPQSPPARPTPTPQSAPARPTPAPQPVPSFTAAPQPAAVRPQPVISPAPVSPASSGSLAAQSSGSLPAQSSGSLPAQSSGSMPAISRTTTPATPMPASKMPARPATPAAGVPTTPTATPSAAGTAPPVISRTTTPAIPMPASRMPAKPAEPPRAAIAEIDPPTIPRGIDPPTLPRGLDAPTQRRAAPPPPDAEAYEPATVRRPPAGDISVVLPDATDAERAALAEQGDLDPDTRLRILAMARLVDARDPYALLGVDSGADLKTLKRTYFKLSKEIHPDRFYGRQLGSFADRLSVVFEAVSRAYARLTSPEKSRPSSAHQAVNSEQPQTPGEYAAELFDRACALEVGGDHLGAMKLFAAAVRIDPQTRYLRRAASCALQAEQPKTALEYAKKAQTQAPNDPSAARLLASAFKATGRFTDAEEVLVMAMAIKSENDVLTAELRNDLAEVRRLMSG